jgi:hypothetical protein
LEILEKLAVPVSHSQQIGNLFPFFVKAKVSSVAGLVKLALADER